MNKIAILFCLLATFPQINSSAQKVEPEAEAQQSKYLPLSVGSKWVYRKTVPPGARVFAWESFVINKKINFVFGPVKDIKPGTYEETFVVKDRIREDGRERWVIDVGKKETARDGRYSGLASRVDNVLWGRLVSSEQVIEIGEIMIWDHFAGPFRQERTLLVEPVHKDVEAHIMRLSPVVVNNLSKRITISVPAGKFDECLEIVTEVKVPDVEDKVEKVWKTHSYYAPNVGLVKEEQKTTDGKSTYVLELVKYELAKEDNKK